MKMKLIKIFVLLSAISLMFPALAANAAINSLNSLTATTQSFATTTDANIRLSIKSTGSVHTINPSWTGILQPARGGTGASTFATGSILFFQNGKISEDNANLFWDDTNNRLGIGTGTSSPAYTLDINGSVRWSGSLQGGSVPWSRLTSFPTGCGANQAVQSIGASLTCINIATSTGSSVSSIQQGTGIVITPNPLTSSGTIAINTSVVPRKNIDETITGSWIFNGTSTTFVSRVNLPGSGVWSSTGTIFNATTTFNSKLYLPGSGIWDNSGNVGIGTQTPGQKLSVAGIIESTSGGFKFPDGSIQTAAATSTGGGGGSNVPVGSVISYAGVNVPSGWFLADGHQVSRTDYSALFSAIGTNYGAGDGVTTFNLPNLTPDTTDGLISYWPMEGSSNDTKGTNNGSDTNINYGSLYGKFGQGAYFNGDSKIDVGSGNLNITSDPLTISLWVNFNSVSSLAMLFDKDDGTTSGVQYRVWMYDGNTLAGAVDNNNSSNTEAHYTFALATGVWYHVAFVFDGSNNILYVNGNQVDSEPFSGTRATCSSNAVMGQRPADNYGKLDGNLDEVRVYNRALSQTEIQNLYLNNALSVITSIIKY